MHFYFIQLLSFFLIWGATQSNNPVTLKEEKEGEAWVTSAWAKIRTEGEDEQEYRMRWVGEGEED